jgi:hypothetical protein
VDSLARIETKSAIPEPMTSLFLEESIGNKGTCRDMKPTGRGRSKTSSARIIKAEHPQPESSKQDILNQDHQSRTSPVKIIDGYRRRN